MTKQITERDRLDLRTELIDAIGEDSADVLMEALPPLNYDELATKSDLTVLAKELRADMAQTKGALAKEMAANLRVSVAANVGSMMGLVALIVGLG